jgi:magnesium transporter
MILRHESHGTFWVDVEQPTPEEIHALSREFSIGERIETELLTPSPLPLVAGDAEHALLVLHFPTHTEDGGDPKNQEIDFVVGRNFVLTIRYEVVAPLHHLHKVLETNALVNNNFDLHADTFLEILFAHLFAAIRDHTNHVAGHLGHIEKEMFDGHERETIRRISEINREFLHLESATASHEEPLTRFLQALERRAFFGPAFEERALRIRAENEQITRLIKTHRAVAAELRETNGVLLEARQNEIMKTLTVVTFIILPLELILGLFELKVPDVPFETNPDAFFIIVGILLAVAGTLTLFFARKRWIF